MEVPTPTSQPSEGGLEVYCWQVTSANPVIFDHLEGAQGCGESPLQPLWIHVPFSSAFLAQLSQGSTSDAIVSISSHGSRKHRYG